MKFRRRKSCFWHVNYYVTRHNSSLVSRFFQKPSSEEQDLRFFIFLLTVITFCHGFETRKATAKEAKIILVAGKPSHPPRMHEFNAGVQLMTDCLKDTPNNIDVQVVLNGWPKDESVLVVPVL